jgi:hypothetical protein
VFPVDLADVPSDRISFHLTVLVGGKRKTVQIAPAAWPDVLPSLAKFEIIDIVVSPLNPPSKQTHARSVPSDRRAGSAHDRRAPAARRTHQSRVCSPYTSPSKKTAELPATTQSKPIQFFARLLDKL